MNILKIYQPVKLFGRSKHTWAAPYTVSLLIKAGNLLRQDKVA